MDQMIAPRRAELTALTRTRFQQSMTVPEAFFQSESERIAQACWAMARRFHEGGRLIAFGCGSSATDAQHVSVEFVHPVIVGKRALPALALTNDSASLSGMTWEGDTTQIFARQLRVLARPQDIAMSFSLERDCTPILHGLRAAHQLGMLTLDLTGARGGPDPQRPVEKENVADYTFIIPAIEPTVIQETQETLYHVLWELVHVFFEHKGLLE